MISYGETPLVTAFLLFFENYYNRVVIITHQLAGLKWVVIKNVVCDMNLQYIFYFVWMQQKHVLWSLM